MPQSRLRSARAAFTLVELLVVISIIGVLMAILLPALNAARAAAWRTTCLSNQRQLGLGVTTYESEKKKFPASMSYAENSPDPNNRLTLPWTVRILPYIGEQVRYDDIVNRNPDLSLAANPNLIFIPVFACTADPTPSAGPALSYVANVGKPDVIANPLQPNNANNRKAVGIFHDARYFPNHDVRRTSVKDGLSQTLLFTENQNADLWTDRLENRIGFVWLDVMAGTSEFDPASNNPLPINFGPYDAPTTATDYSRSRPSGNHTDIFVGTMTDGAVRTFNQEIDWHVLYRLMSPDGKACSVTAGQPDASFPAGTTNWQGVAVNPNAVRP